jgi:ribosome biogenesis GTPase
MGRRPRKPPREKDLTSRYLQGDSEADRLESHQKFSHRSKNAQQDKMEKTAVIRAADAGQSADLERLPIGQVVQVFSLYYQVEHPTGPRLCSTRKTLGKLSQTSIVVGDQVRFRDTEQRDELGRQEAVIEQVLPRQTILTRAEGTRGNDQHPIVANAQQMLIVASLLRPRVKWGLVDRMIVAAQSGGLTPLICLNKIDLAEPAAESQAEHVAAKEVLAHYQSLGFTTFQVSASGGEADRCGGEAYRTPRSGIEGVKSALAGKTTVLAGHSGVGKSTLISAVQPGLDIRIGEISNFNDKGRHTTSSARRYPLDIGGYVIDTPGVKLFGLWGVTTENLLDFFPDVQNESAPQWRIDSFNRIHESISD